MANINMDMEYIDMQMEIFMKDSGRMINSKEAEFCNLLMVRFIKANSSKGSHMEKVFITTSLFNMMILSNIVEVGQYLSHMDLVKQLITMVMFMKEILLKESVVEMELTGSIKYTNMLGNGSITAFGEKGSCTRINKFSFRVCLKKD